MSSTADTAVAAPAVLVADERPLVRDGIKALISGMLGEVHFLDAEDATSLLLAPRAATVRLGLVGLNMPGMNGGLRLQEFARQYPSIPLVVVSAITAAEIVRRTLSIPSVCAFMPISADIATLRQAVEAALQGTKIMLTSAERTALVSGLTPRQEEIHRLLRAGLSNKMIAGTLGISEGTVKNHISEIFKALNATNRTQAARFVPLAGSSGNSDLT